MVATGLTPPLLMLVGWSTFHIASASSSCSCTSKPVCSAPAPAFHGTVTKQVLLVGLVLPESCEFFAFSCQALCWQDIPELMGVQGRCSNASVKTVLFVMVMFLVDCSFLPSPKLFWCEMQPCRSKSPWCLLGRAPLLLSLHCDQI